MIAFAAPAFAQQTLQPGSPGVGAGGQQPYTGGPADAGPDQNGMRNGMSEGRAAAPDYQNDTARSRNERIDPMAPNSKSRSNGN
jgi:hypothetical protein